MDKQTLEREIFDARRDVLALLRRVPESVALKVPAADGWSIKDIVAHLAEWEDRQLTGAQKVVWGDGHKVQWLRRPEDKAAWNAHTQARLAGWTWAEALRALALQREETDWNLTYLTAEQLEASYEDASGTLRVADMLYEIAVHDREHLAQLQALPAQLQALPAQLQALYGG